LPNSELDAYGEARNVSVTVMDTATLTPIDQLIVACAEVSLDWKAEFPDARLPKMVVNDGSAAHEISLRDHPTLFEEIKPRVFALTAAARRRYAELTRNAA
jgi:hypothetical protein